LIILAFFTKAVFLGAIVRLPFFAARTVGFLPFADPSFDLIAPWAMTRLEKIDAMQCDAQADSTQTALKLCW